MAAKILITGSNGLLGQKLIQCFLKDQNFELIATSKGENRSIMQTGYTYESLDITDELEVVAILKKYQPDCILHAAAMTNVDACELNPAACKSNNIDAVQYFMNGIHQVYDKTYLPHFIYISTDFIFDGTKGPLDENDQPNPISIYGESKYEAEKIVQNSQVPFAILRTVLVFGINEGAARSNVVLWVKNNLEANQTINVVNDQYRTPTLVEDLAQGCYLAAKQKALGIYNISGPDMMHIYDLACHVAHHFKLNAELIQSASSEGIKQPAKRPPITGFVIEKAKRELGYRPHSFKEALAVIEQQLKGNF
jgi:dTDP-4-dehydrorhamnose reductase